MLDDSNTTLDLLSLLSDSFKAVEHQTTGFQAQCQDVLSEGERLASLAEGISGNLRYYALFDPITRRLNAPGAGNRVRDREFSDMLSQLDGCLKYMQTHPKQREAAAYRARYRQLLTRGLTLIRVHFTNSLREIAADIAGRIADKQLNDTMMSALLYTKFKVPALEMRRLALEIQKRADPFPDSVQGGTGEAEYQSLMNELYQSYSATRGRLMLPIISKKMHEIAMTPSSSKDLVAFARSSIGYIKGICSDEYDLWRDWFDGEGGMYDFLEAICEPLYDHIRPRIIHEAKLITLCELCTLLQTRYMGGEEDEDEPIEKPQLDFASLVQPAFTDAQTRLVFLSLAVLRDEIQNFKPKPEHLDYPSQNRRASILDRRDRQPILSGRKASINGGETAPKGRTVGDIDEAKQDEDLQWAYARGTGPQGWYPTLRKAVWLLSKIYRLINV